MKKRKVLGLMLSTSLVLTSLFTSAALAETAPPQPEKPAFVESTDAILKSGKSYEDRITALENAGWEVTPQEQIIQPRSAAGCGNQSFTMMKQESTPGSGDWWYLIQTDWAFDFAKSGCSWDSGSDGAVDMLFLGVIDNNNQAVNQQPNYAQIYVKDKNGNDKSANGGVSGFDSSAVKYTINDTGDYVFGDKAIGSKGQAWFYIKKPTSSSGGYLIRSVWRHTWSSSSISLTSATVSFPWAISTTWSGSSTPNTHDYADQTSYSFP